MIFIIIIITILIAIHIEPNFSMYNSNRRLDNLSHNKKTNNISTSTPICTISIVKPRKSKKAKKAIHNFNSFFIIMPASAKRPSETLIIRSPTEASSPYRRRPQTQTTQLTNLLLRPQIQFSPTPTLNRSDPVIRAGF